MATTTKPSNGRNLQVLPTSEPQPLGLDPARLAQLEALIESHIKENRYPGAQVAMARNGKLAIFKTFGDAKIGADRSPATDDSLWLMFSQTKVVVAAAVWQLVDEGAVRFADRISDHIPDFDRNGKGDITVYQLLSHQGGFPSATVPEEAWTDHEVLKSAVCDFTLEWTPGSKVQYHGTSAHWVAAALIESLRGRDYRDVIRDNLLAPLGLENDIFVGVPPEEQPRCTNIHVFEDDEIVPSDRNTSQWRSAGVPGAGGYATAAGMATLYQALLAGGALNGTRVLSPRVIQFATRNHTDERVDENMGMPMHRGLGPHVRGNTPTIRGLGTIASPSTFGHGGAGTSFSWGDPESGVSFTYVTNCMAPEPWHSVRLDQISNIAHASIIGP